MERVQQVADRLAQTLGVEKVPVVVSDTEGWASLAPQGVRVGRQVLELEDEFLAATLAHELAHRKLGHDRVGSWWVDASVGLPLLAGAAWLASSVGILAGLGFQLLVMGLWILTDKAQARRREHAADALGAAALEAAGYSEDGRLTMAQLLEYASSRVLVLPHHPGAGATWVQKVRWQYEKILSEHPTIPQRVRSLSQT